MAGRESCPNSTELAEFLDGRLPADQTERLGQHLESCAQCQHLAAELPSADHLVTALGSTDHTAVLQEPAFDRLQASLRRLSGLSAVFASVLPDWKDHLAESQAADEIGRLGGFRILRLLGAGGMGGVFEAEDPKLQRLVAIKIMRPDLAIKVEHRERFLREARAVASLQDEHVVPIHLVDESCDRHGGNLPYLVMPLLQGETLQTRMARAPAVTMAEILEIARQLTLGLVAAHSAGIVHRDLKPENIWLEPKPNDHAMAHQAAHTGAAGATAQTAPGFRVKLLDFGLARPREPETGLTLDGAIVGTPGYMAPEQAAGKEATTSSDLFSLGCVFYQLATGQRPFRGPDLLATLRSLSVDVPVEPHVLNVAISREFSDLTMHLLEKEPPQRPHSATDVVTSINRMQSQSRRRTNWSAAKVGLAGLAAMLLCLVVIRIRHPNGRETVVKAPAGSTASINEKGEVVVTLPEKPGVSASLPSNTKSSRAPLDGLQRSAIPRHELINAGGGDPAKVAPELVGVLGDSRFKHWMWALQVLLHPDGKTVVSLGSDEAICGWSSETGEQRYLLADRPYQQLALSDDGRWLVLGDKSGHVSLHDSITGAHVRDFPSHADAVVSLAFDHAGKRLASGAKGRTLHLSNVETGEKIWTVSTPGPLALAFAEDDSRLIGAFGNKLYHWQADTGTVALEERTDLVHRGLNPHWLLSSKPNSNEAIISDATSGAVHATLHGHDSPITALAASSDGKWFATGARHESIRLWHADGQLARRIPVIADHTTLDLAFSADGSTLVSGDDYYRVNLWDATTGKPKFVHQWTSGANVVQISRDGGTIYWSTADPRHATINTVHAFQAATLHAEPFVISAPRLVAVALRPDGQAIATGDVDGVVQIWDRTGRPLNRFDSHKGSVISLAWHPDGQFLASIGGAQSPQGDPAVTVWNSATNEVVHTLKFAKPVFAVTFHPQRKLLAVGCNDGFLRLFDVTTGQNVATQASQTRTLGRQRNHSLSFSADGSRLIAALDQGAQVFEITTTDDGALVEIQEKRLLQGHTATVTSVACHPDGRLAATCSTDGSIRLWDIDSGRETRKIGISIPRSPSYADVVFSPEGRHLLASNSNTTVHIYRLSEADK